MKTKDWANASNSKKMYWRKEDRKVKGSVIKVRDERSSEIIPRSYKETPKKDQTSTQRGKSPPPYPVDTSWISTVILPSSAGPT
jgi:hypothetical protein